MVISLGLPAPTAKATDQEAKVAECCSNDGWIGGQAKRSSQGSEVTACYLWLQIQNVGTGKVPHPPGYCQWSRESRKVRSPPTKMLHCLIHSSSCWLQGHHALYYHQLGCPMHYPANNNNPSIINLVFLSRNDEESIISMGKHGESDHCLLFVELRFPIFTGNKPPSMNADLEADTEFTSDVIDTLNVIADHMKNLPVSQLHDNITHIMTLISECFAKAWEAHATSLWMSVHSKGWWDKSCSEAWSQYRESDCSSNEWCNMQCTMKAAKRKYFDEKITSIADHKKRPWNLMSWTRAWKLDSSEAIIFKGESCLTTEDHWNAFQEPFNSAHKQDTYPTCLMWAIHPKPKQAWVPFSACKLCEMLTGCLGWSVSSPDYII